MQCAHSDVVLLVHVIWATRWRRRLLTVNDDDWIAAAVSAACARSSSELVAVGNADDHVHVIVWLHPTICVATLVKRMKGGSSHAWNARGDRATLEWQSGYWARTLDREALASLIPYVKNQRIHHANSSTSRNWEQNPPTAGATS